MSWLVVVDELSRGEMQVTLSAPQRLSAKLAKKLFGAQKREKVNYNIAMPSSGKVQGTALILGSVLQFESTLLANARQ